MKDRFNNILAHPVYQEHLQRIDHHEVGRLFCKHEIDHFFDVARITYILSLEKKILILKDVIYAASLLHDIGKWQEIELRIPHEVSSATLCVDILKDCQYNKIEIELIQDAIINHRNSDIKNQDTLGGILYQADKLSRKCFQCEQAVNCNWKQKKKNLKMRY